MKFETAIDVLVRASAGSSPDNYVSANLIAAVIAPKYSFISEDEILAAIGISLKRLRDRGQMTPADSVTVYHALPS